MTYKHWILAAALLSSGIVFLDSTVVNVALPRIGRDLPRLFLGVLDERDTEVPAPMGALEGA